MIVQTKALFYCIIIIGTSTIATASWKHVLLDVLGTHHKRTTNFRHTNSYNNYTFTEWQAKQYIAQCVASLDHALRPSIKDRHVTQLRQRITNATINNANAYYYTTYGKRYSKDLIDQYINSAILEYIEETSYNYAYKKSHNSTIARKIAESMRNNALARIQQSAVLNYESLTQFVGSALRRAVYEAINRYDAPYTTSQPYYTQPSYPTTHEQRPPAQSPEYQEEQKYYPSDACCSCLESFDNRSIHRVFLKPCGHDMCKNCAYEWFFIPNRNDHKTCPHCRSKVNLDVLSIEVASAPISA